MPSPLESFLQEMLSEKSDHSTGTAEITIVMDNACPARHHKRSNTSTRCSLDVSDHSRGKSRWVADNRLDSLSPVPQAPKHRLSPKLKFAKTPVAECDDEDDYDSDDDGLIL